ncbi:MAG: lysophospholipid acyltransferase family protein [Myxococcota bacterium]|nr:lysophospholipid acyltransferase family protein [Myxococcota bacterium]
MRFVEVLIGFFWWFCFPIRKKLAIEQYQRCFPARDPRELRKSVGTCAGQYIEIFMGRRAVVRYPASLMKGGICLAGHGVGWDIALMSLGAHVPITIFVRDLPPSWFHRWLSKIRKRNNIEELRGSHTMQRGYEALKEGRLLIFVQDQRYHKGIKTLFFGRECYTSPAFAVAALERDVPIYGAWQTKEDGRYVATIERLPLHHVQRDKKSVESLTQQTQDFYERKIRENPHGWLWLHKRWKIPP